MKEERWKELMDDINSHLTDSEIKEGWHFCNEVDGLLVGPGMFEQKHCSTGAGCPKVKWRHKLNLQWMKAQIYFQSLYRPSHERKTVGSEPFDF